MKVPVPAFFALAALILNVYVCIGEEGLYLQVSASPSTFTSVGETITFTYAVRGEDELVLRNGYSLTDDAADAEPSCQADYKYIRYMTCTATHIVTAQDIALGYVTSHAVVEAYVGIKNIIRFTPVKLKVKATTVVYIENFTPSPTPTVTPLASATPAVTPTITATPDTSENAEVIFEKGNTAELVDCSGTEFAFTVKDPEGIKQAYIEFAVAGFDTDFSNIAATLDLTNSGGDTWSGIFNDTVSTKGQVTYWRVVVVDNNNVKTVYYEDGKFSFYARDKSCN